MFHERGGGFENIVDLMRLSDGTIGRKVLKCFLAFAFFEEKTSVCYSSILRVAYYNHWNKINTWTRRYSLSTLTNVFKCLDQTIVSRYIQCRIM